MVKLNGGKRSLDWKKKILLPDSQITSGIDPESGKVG